MQEPYIKRILSAQVYDVAVETPIDAMPALSQALNNQVLSKREDLQTGFSFKLRGAYHKISRLSPAQRKRGVVAASAGNHAQGVALSARTLRTAATIVMPVTTPAIKVDSTKALGGKAVRVILHGDRFDDACDRALAICRQSGATFVHPYDDPDIIAGQGTIGVEIQRQCTGALDKVFIPVGGGGLLAGIGVYLKYVRPDTKIIAVECEESACLKAALKAGKRVTLPHVGIFADGVAVAQIGKEPFRLACKVVDDCVTVSNDEICAAIKKNFDDTRSIAEPAGALALAGLIKYVQRKGSAGKPCWPSTAAPIPISIACATCRNATGSASRPRPCLRLPLPSRPALCCHCARPWVVLTSRSLTTVGTIPSPPTSLWDSSYPMAARTDARSCRSSAGGVSRFRTYPAMKWPSCTWAI